MSFSRRKRRGNFGMLLEVQCAVRKSQSKIEPDTSARLNKFFSKIEQVKKVGDVLKFSAPKDTEVNRKHGRSGITIEAQSCSVEFGQKYL